MALPLADLADILRAAGLVVIEYPGWRDRTQRDGAFSPRAVMWHHDASALGDSPGVPAMMANLDNNGAQVWVDRYGRWHLVAAGRMWHAGTGGPWGVIPAGAGNTYSVGIETDHTTGEDWPAAQLSSLRRGTAAIMRARGWSPWNALCGHKEYRVTNPDPDGLDMDHERRAVAELIAHDLEDDMPLTDEDVRKILDYQVERKGSYGGPGVMTLRLLLEWWPHFTEGGIADSLLDTRVPYPVDIVDPVTGDVVHHAGDEITLRELWRWEEPREQGARRLLLDAIQAGGTGGGPIDYELLVEAQASSPTYLRAVATAFVDELDRRARDGDPATGPTT